MRINKYILLLFALSLSLSLSAKEYFVAIDGSDKNKGTIEAPLRTVKYAISKLRAGDVCYIRGGCYREIIDINSLSGKPGEPIRIEVYNGERVRFAGTTQLDNLDWQSSEEGVYSTKIDFPITQLFVDGRSMVSARYPNANWYDGSLWDKSISQIWPEAGQMGRYENKQLSELDFSMEGASIIVNSGSFKTYASFITSHKAGDSHFEYDQSTVKGHFTTTDQVARHGYYIEGLAELVDTAEEWFYDRHTGVLYLFTPQGRHPNEFTIEGKTQTYFIEGRNCEHLVISGIEFFGTTIYFNNSYDITIEDCDFNFPNYNRRMLGDLSWVDVTSMLAKNIDQEVKYSFVNCEFSFGDGPAIKMRGRDCRVENCSFNDFDFSCINAGGFMFDLGSTTALLFRRNTAYNTGNSEMLQVGREAIVELNDLSHCGFLQNDGSVIQVSVAGQDNSYIRYNWVHDAIKQGIRFDNTNLPGSPWGRNGTVHHNVVWNTERTFFKGDEHFIFNNTCFDNAKNDLIISANIKINGRNFETVTQNNLAGQISGDINKPASEVAPPGHLQCNIEAKEGVEHYLRDVKNRDFRPRAASALIDNGKAIDKREVAFVGDAPDIGAYEWGDTNYWIPGRKLEEASSPIPMNGAMSTPASCDLMWLGGYKQSEFKVYLGTSPDELQHVATQQNNIFTPTGLEPGRSYFWRINDGAVWSFSVEGSSK